MSKVVYNDSWGVYSLPDEVLEKYCKRKGIDFSKVSPFALEDKIPRHDPVLVKIVEEYIKIKNCDLAVEDIGDSNKYYIEDYDGMECVRTIENIPWIPIKLKLSKKDLRETMRND